MAQRIRSLIGSLKTRIGEKVDELMQQTSDQMVWKEPFQRQQRRWESSFPRIKQKEFDNVRLEFLTHEHLSQLYEENHLIIHDFLGSRDVSMSIHEYMHGMTPEMFAETHDTHRTYDGTLQRQTKIESYPKSIMYTEPWIPITEHVAKLERDLRMLGVYALGKHTEGLVTVYHENDDYGWHLDDYEYFKHVAPQGSYVDSLQLEVSIFYYANPFWDSSQGGRLELFYYDFDQDKLTNKFIEPRADTIVIFPSKLCLHGVEKFTGNRRVMAVWWMHDKYNKSVISSTGERITSTSGQHYQPTRGKTKPMHNKPKE